MDKVPEELIVDIFIKTSSLQDVLNLSKTNKSLAYIFKENKTYICKERLKYHFNGMTAPEGQECVFLKVAESLPRDVNLNDLFINNIALVSPTLVIHVLIHMGADVNTRNDLALQMAVESGDIDTVKLLLEHGANIHVLEDYPLRQAVREENFEMTKLLLEHGADMRAKDYEALRVAIDDGYDQIKELLIQHYYTHKSER